MSILLEKSLDQLDDIQFCDNTWQEAEIAKSQAIDIVTGLCGYINRLEIIIQQLQQELDKER